MRLVAILMATLFIASPTIAQVYKWVDETGTTHYTQTPPPAKVKAKVESINVDKTTGSAPTKAAAKNDSKSTKAKRPKAKKPVDTSKVSPQRIEKHCKKVVAGFLGGASSDVKSQEIEKCKHNLKDADAEKMKEVEGVAEVL